MPTPNYASPSGTYELDDVLQTIKSHWLLGRQIVPLLGAGISIESGVPAITPLHEHLLALLALQKREFHWNREKTSTPAYALDRDDWIAPSRLTEYFPLPSADGETGGKDRVVAALLKEMFWKIGDNDELTALKEAGDAAIDAHVADYSRDFANLMGKDWLALMQEVAQHRPELVDILSDALSARAIPNITHNLLTHCVTWFNIRLILTTNFDPLVEQSLLKEGLAISPFEVHMQAPPPPKLLIQRQLSLIKLHGGHYGLRADQSVNRPLEDGHLQTILNYFDDDAILLCLGYGGGERRITGFLEKLLDEKKNSQIIRIDPMSPREGSFFYRMCNSEKYEPTNGKPRVRNLYYPPSIGFFLLHLYQYAANFLPNARQPYSTFSHTPPPLKANLKLGFGSVRPNNGETTATATTAVEETTTQVLQHLKENKWAVVSSEGNAGTSQVLARIYENLFGSHQIVWCNLDEMTSVGTILGQIQEFVNSRQPNFPVTPLPFHLPPFNADSPTSTEDFVDIKRVARILWSRLEREKFVVVLDSLSCALAKLCAKGDERNKREAFHILLLVAVLMKISEESTGRCLLVIGTHKEKEQEKIASPPSIGGLITNLKNELEGKSENEEEILEYAKKLLKPNDQQNDDGWFTIIGESTVHSIGDTITVTNLTKRLQKNFPKTSKKTISPADSGMGKFSDSWYGNSINSFLVRFIVESALCDRPRSWRQLMQLPVIKEMAKQAKDEEKGMIDLRVKALACMVKLAINRRLFYLQAGGFFSMDGFHRNELRKCAGILGDKGKATHERMAEYFRRTYNQGGDVAALNHYFYHREKLLEIEPNEAAEIVESTIERILENSLPSRGFLYAYDHCFLLLRLLDMLKDKEGSFFTKSETEEKLQEEEKLQGEKKYLALRKRILNTLCEVYEDGGDAKNGIAVAKEMEKNANEVQKLRQGARPTGSSTSGVSTSTNARRTDAIGLAQAYYRLQKAHWQGLDVSPSCFYALKALQCLFDNTTSTSVTKTSGLIDILPAIYEVVGLSLPEDSATDVQKAVADVRLEYLKNGYAPQRILVHRVFLRLMRSLIRLSTFGTAAANKETDENKKTENKKTLLLMTHLCDIFAAFGADICAGNEVSATEIKLLESRYMASRALKALYEANSSSRAMLYRTAYFNQQAQANTLRLDGVQSTVREAITLTEDAEMLLWNARFHLNHVLAKEQEKEKRKQAYTYAAARQEAALRHLESAHAKLAMGTVSLPAWCELTALRIAATADILKRLTGQYLETLDAGKEDAGKEDAEKRCDKILAEFAYHAERAAFELGHFLPLLRNNAWRGSRSAIQLLRVAGYMSRMMGEIVKKLDDKKTAEERKSTLIVSLNTLIRAVNNFDLIRQNKLPLIPLDDASAHDTFLRDLWVGLATWVVRINTWGVQLLNRSKNSMWKDVSHARLRLEKRRKRWCKNLCLPEMQEILKAKENDEAVGRAIEALREAWDAKDSAWRRNVKIWPDGYGTLIDGSSETAPETSITGE